MRAFRLPLRDMRVCLLSARMMQMLRLLPDPARTIVAVAAFLGLRRGEIRGLEWPDYTGEEIRVMRSVWESVTSEPKTRKSKAPGRS